MNPAIRNTLAVIVGIVVGSIVNMGLVMVGPMIIPLPEGADNSTMEKLRESMGLLTAKHFLFPFLAHALGTLTGALVTARLAASKSIICALVVGVFFLFGGIMAIRSIGGPMWFIIVDLVFAYLPMAYLGGLITSNRAQ